jgi:hypothetical protein
MNSHLRRRRAVTLLITFLRGTSPVVFIQNKTGTRITAR